MFSHFTSFFNWPTNSGRNWNQPQVKNCAGQARPLAGSTYSGAVPPALAVEKKVLSKMRVPVKLLDITALSQLRVDAHPSFYGAGAAAADCTHWCIAGLPDTWNQLLYNLLHRYTEKEQEHKKG